MTSRTLVLLNLLFTVAAFAAFVGSGQRGYSLGFTEGARQYAGYRASLCYQAGLSVGAASPEVLADPEAARSVKHIEELCGVTR